MDGMGHGAVAVGCDAGAIGYDAGAIERDPRWALVLARDPAADGRFWYSVRTSGAYCRPSCASRPANPRNVRFHVSPAAAEAAGFRACQRCRPDLAPLSERRAAIVAEACRRIEAAEEMPDLVALADGAGMSAHHFHRVFRAVTGLTPRAFAAAHRARRVRDALPTAPSVTSALYGAGFNAASRFYAAADGALGMTPAAFRAGGAAEEIRYALGGCSLGAILVAAAARGVCAILLGESPDALVADLRRRFPRAAIVAGDAGFGAVVARAVALVEAPALGHDLPLDLRGTAFQQRVWRALRDIPPGETATYAAIARRIGAPAAVRAVGAACGANALAVAVPCHRVVRGDGALSGYRWGAERKRRLLARERGE